MNKELVVKLFLISILLVIIACALLSVGCYIPGWVCSGIACIIALITSIKMWKE